MAGEAVNPGAGFHKIALQVAITGSALGKKEEEILAACEGLVEKHLKQRKKRTLRRALLLSPTVPLRRRVRGLWRDKGRRYQCEER